MEIIDIIVIVLLVIGLISGIKDGLIKRVMGLAGLIAGLLIGRAIYLSVAARLTPILGTSEKVTQVIAFALILIVVPLIFSLIAWLISNLLKTVGLGWVNRLLGGVIGAVMNAIIVGLVFMGIESFDVHEHLITHEKKEASLFYQPLCNMSSVLLKDVREQIDQWKEENASDGEEPADNADDPLEKKEKPELQSFEEVV